MRPLGHRGIGVDPPVRIPGIPRFHRQIVQASAISFHGRFILGSRFKQRHSKWSMGRKKNARRFRCGRGGGDGILHAQVARDGAGVTRGDILYSMGAP